jgi:hypothetical protein
MVGPCLYESLVFSASQLLPEECRGHARQASSWKHRNFTVNELKEEHALSNIFVRLTGVAFIVFGNSFIHQKVPSGH